MLAMRAVFRGILLARRVWDLTVRSYTLQDQSSFKAALNVVVAEERALDAPEDQTDVGSPRNGLYAHLCQDDSRSGYQPGGLISFYPSPFD